MSRAGSRGPERHLSRQEGLLQGGDATPAETGRMRRWAPPAAVPAGGQQEEGEPVKRDWTESVTRGPL